MKKHSLSMIELDDFSEWNFYNKITKSKSQSLKKHYSESDLYDNKYFLLQKKNPIFLLKKFYYLYLYNKYKEIID